MKIKNLTNNTAVTISSCEQELIHIPGSIQPHGFLLGVDEADFFITYCSENTQIFLKKPIADILGQPLNSFFKAEEIEGFKTLLQDTKQGFARPYIFIFDGKSYNITSYSSNNTIVLEFEILVEEKLELPDLYIQTRRFVYHTERSDNLKNLCQNIAEETRDITGFDRVMIYCFDEEYNGEVYAESKREDLDPF
jgi:two-component system, chemotaxis family, sensor kinase Cph1